MGEPTLTSAELELSADERRAWAMLLHVALVGWGDDFGGTEATALLGLLTRLSSLARAGLEAGKAEESMREATHRHKKRGTEYVLIGLGTWVSLNPGYDDDDVYVREAAPGVLHVRHSFSVPGTEWARVQCADLIQTSAIIAIYRSVDDGSLWVRPREEFEDGRFEAIRALPLTGGDKP